MLHITGPTGQRQAALPDQSVVVGRAEDSDIIIDDIQASRYHVQLTWRGAEFEVIDLGSANGTQINDAPIPQRSPRPLHHGDVIRIGDHALHYWAAVVPVHAGNQRVHNTVIDRLPASDDMPTMLETPPVVVADPFATMAPQSPPLLLIASSHGNLKVLLTAPVISLGRGDENDIIIDDRSVSRRHAELRAEGDSYVIRDLGSSNGLTVRGATVAEHHLEDGDAVNIGATVTLTYHRWDDEAAGRRPGQRLDLRNREQLLIGRLDANDLVLDHPTVSRFHARIVARPGDGGFTIEDVDSANGTFVNGERLAPGQPRPLQPGDSVRIGLVRLIYQPDAIEQVDDSHNLRLDVLHLNQPVKSGINLLQDISLAIPARSFVALVGVSGAGKSTLLTALSGFRPAAQGQVLVNGENLYRNFDAWRTSFGYVPQDDIIHLELPVERALGYAARLRLPNDTSPAERGARVATVMSTLGLRERATVPVGSLSGGQRKRVSMGVELLTEPGLIYLDEATSGLDPGTELQMMRLLRQLANSGHTIVLVTHATKNVAMCDQVIFLARGGHLAWYGPPADALTYFDVSDFDQIYEQLETESTPAEWAERFRASPHFQRSIAGPLTERYGAAYTSATAAADKPAPAAAERGRRGRKGSLFRQMTVLSARYIDIMRRDRASLILLVLAAPLLAAIDLIAWPRDILHPVKGTADRTMTMFFLGTVNPFLVGALSSVREIVKESAIYRRERAVILRTLPYLLSKIWVALLFSLYNGAVFLGVRLLAVDFSSAGASGIGALFITLVLASLSGAMLGLVLSAVAQREEQVMMMLVLAVVVQIVFSGAILPLSNLGPAGNVIGTITSSKWIFQAEVAAARVRTGDCEGPSLETCRLPGIQQYGSHAERRVVVRALDERSGDARPPADDRCRAATHPAAIRRRR